MTDLDRAGTVVPLFFALADISKKKMLECFYIDVSASYIFIAKMWVINNHYALFTKIKF